MARTKTTKSNATPQTGFRLEASILERLDAHARRLTEASAVPGKRYTRADALRALLLPALDAAEAADKRRKG